MAPSVIAGLVGLALLAVLTPIAIRDRRIGSDNFPPPPGDPLALGTSVFPPSPAAVSQPITAGKIAFGVFLGLWLFLISVAIPTMLLMRHYWDEWIGR